MNMLKALFTGWFPLFLEPVTELLGFLSPKAKSYVKNCSDHHKAWQILEVLARHDKSNFSLKH